MNRFVKGIVTGMVVGGMAGMLFMPEAAATKMGRKYIRTKKRVMDRVGRALSDTLGIMR